MEQAVARVADEAARNGEEVSGAVNSLKTVALVVYILEILSFFIPFTGLIGVIVAYIKRSDAKDTWVYDHFTWQINTFWIAVALAVVGFFTTMIFIGWFILLAALVWNIYRVVKGWLRLNDQKSPYAA